MLLAVQGVLTLLAALLLWLLSPAHALSGFAGGGIATLSSALFAQRIFVPYRAQAMGLLVARFYGAEVRKLLYAGVMFAAAIKWLDPLSVGALFGVFLLVQLAPPLIIWKFV